MKIEAGLGGAACSRRGGEEGGCVCVCVCVCRVGEMFFLRGEIKLEKNKRTNGCVFTHAHPNILKISSVLCSGNPHNQKTSPSLPCASLEPELRNRLIRICGPPTPQNMQQMLVCNWCGREFCVIPPQLILQTYFCVIDYAECHYTFLKIDSQIIFLRV